VRAAGNTPSAANPRADNARSHAVRPFDVRGLSHRGLVRAHNEDAWYAESGLGLAMVADGVGGHANGAVASQSAVRWIANYLRRINALIPRLRRFERAEQERTIARAIALANKRLVAVNAATADVRQRCGTTIVGIWAPRGAGSPATIFHVGDSRLYLLRKDADLEPLTRDHSAYQQWIESGKQGSPPPKSYILQALGLSEVAPDITSIDVGAGDRFLLCSDGLSNGIAVAEMQQVMSEGTSLDTTCERFVSLGLARGGTDNLTSVVGSFS
jgi:serine/threonine protein phosphatase PrpC